MNKNQVYNTLKSITKEIKKLKDTDNILYILSISINDVSGKESRWDIQVILK